MGEIRYDVRPLDANTRPDFARLVERHHGVWGGCWCMGFHPEMSRTSADPNRVEKERRVRADRPHAALVYDGADCVGWCQFGSAAELPGIKYRRQYDDVATAPPDWRITCFFVDRRRRGRGIAAAALAGALNEIARRGGGTVESCPEELDGWEVSKALPYMHGGPVAMFERHGFARVCRLGKHHLLMKAIVAPGARSVAPERRDGSPD